MKKILTLALISLTTITFVSCTNDVSSDTTSQENSSSEVQTIDLQKITLKQVKQGMSQHVFPSLGEQQLIVVPVYFSDFSPETLGINEEQSIKDIYNVFFGDSYNVTNSEHPTGYESVASYYKKSSYGKFTLTGTVTKYCDLGTTLLNHVQTASHSDPITYLKDKVISWLKVEYPSLMANYDSDKDGYYDGLALVFPNNDYESYGSGNACISYYEEYYNTTLTPNMKDNLLTTLFAYTITNTEASNVDNPTCPNYTWLSYNYLKSGNYKDENGNLLVDGHIYIHEFGHLLGLSDYYSSDSTTPVGKLDMMDQNIGDQNSFSKFELDWVKPTLVTSKGTYELTSLEDGGSALIIPSSSEYSYSPFDEYLILELYTPTGLNEFDAKNKYGNYQLIDKTFVKIYHVDARLGLVDTRTKTYKYIHEYPTTLNDYNYVTTTTSNTIASLNNLINVVSKKNPLTVLTKTFDYYQDGYSQGTKLTSFTFNDGNSLKYNIIIKKIDNNKATISIYDK
jgi:M6 family metalloprotease-like protein